MLSDRERKKILEEARHHEHPRAAVSEALMVVQESRGWVSDQGIADVADALGMSREEVDGVATFFDLVFRKPVGKHVLMVCDSVSCWITGAEPLLDHLRRVLGVDLGGTTEDGLFTLLPAGCLGACDAGPAMLVDGALFDRLTPEKAGEILARFRKDEDGTPAHR
jgi:NADH-quinone oxidoreductase subunit E